MTRARTYLDWNASAPMCAEARAAMIDAFDSAGNPSSVHAEGRRARTLVEQAREAVAGLVGASPREVVFTSGATEANATVLAVGWDTIFASPIEHDSVLAAARASGARVEQLAADPSGRAAIDRIARDTINSGRTLVSLQMANNETGVVQPVAEAAAMARAHGFSIHTDAVQAAGRLALDMAALDVDFLSLSGHKIAGPKGIGALIVRDGAMLRPLIGGGGQEQRRRAGTENVAGIAGFGAAARAASIGLARIDTQRALRDQLEAAVRELTPSAVFIGHDAPRLANTSCIALPGRRAETLVIRLDLAGVAVSAGAACSSGKVAASSVLAAMGLAPELTRGAIRISLGSSTRETDILAFIDAWREIATGHEIATGNDIAAGRQIAA